MAGLPNPSFSSTLGAVARRRVAAGLTLLGGLMLSACAITPQQEAYEAALAKARTAPSLCVPDIYAPLVAEAYLKAHENGSADVRDTSSLPDAPAPKLEISNVSTLPDVNFPPYSQRECRMTVKDGTNPPETGFLTVAYFMHGGQVDSSLARWDSDATISHYYDALKEKISKGVDMNNPTLKACMEHYPALHPDSTDPIVQQAAVSLRALLVRRCLADHAALQNLYSDMYFIHR
ncbi:hypothetical protein [Acetobacter vaccinii]|uniref:Uncharacterized protein n=1 Tax=Acetobacter vaccinii TaxID=2592655 RepID=A0A5C1YJS0_9PROT|nr:hypothetical protein [Acetobacter vaccinii]QEO16486.1 hypothetical protein FLP30_00870 [Acetobacter vaccinii]